LVNILGVNQNVYREKFDETREPHPLLLASFATKLLQILNIEDN
jgi:hypothetical protein